MRRKSHYKSILEGYGRIVLAVAVLVVVVVAARLLAFFDLLGPRIAASLPGGALLAGFLLMAILLYGHRWLSRRLTVRAMPPTKSTRN